MAATTVQPLDHALGWAELQPGVRFRSDGRTITETDLVTFVNATWLTEAVFTEVDGEGPGGSAPAARMVPGTLVYAYAEGLVKLSMQAVGLAYLEATISMKAPVRVGDTIRVECEVLETRLTSKPGKALVRFRVDVLNHTGTVVMTYEPLRLVRIPS